MKADFDRLAPEERRIILVASDATYERLVSELDRAKLLGLLPLLLAGSIGLLGAGAASLFLTRALGSTYKGLLRAPTQDGEPTNTKSLVTRALTRGEIVLPHLAPDEAARRFR